MRPVGFEIVRSRDCDRDLAAIFDHMLESYRGLGDTAAEALDRAAARVRSIEATMAGLGRTAFLGRPRPDLLPGLRQLTTDRAVFSFRVDEASREVQVLAVFFGGQDARARTLVRLGRAAANETA
jgi:toxin ParE1/3/4